MTAFAVTQKGKKMDDLISRQQTIEELIGIKQSLDEKASYYRVSNTIKKKIMMSSNRLFPIHNYVVFEHHIFHMRIYALHNITNELAATTQHMSF